MTDITPYKPKNDYIELHKGDKISTIDIEPLYVELHRIIRTIYFVSGQGKSADAKDISVQAKLFANDLKTKYKTLTVAEVSEFMNRGVRKELGEYYGINVVTFNDWAKAFIALPERHASLQTVHKLKEKTLSVDEIADLNKKSIETMIETYRRTGEVLNYGNSNFLFLWKSGQLRFGDTQKELYMIQAENNVNQMLSLELQRAKDELKRSEVKRINEEIEGLISGDNKQVKSEAAKLALKDWIEKQP